MYNGQADQDKFVLLMLHHKRNGFFVEIGSHHPQEINNSYILEKNFNWKGIMVEQRDTWLDQYRYIRPNSIPIIKDATTINYSDLFTTFHVPKNIDYLQIDLEPSNGSTLTTLKKLNEEVMNTYKFAIITFEHDIYRTNFQNTRLESRRIFKERGYFLLFPDVNNKGENSFEDWYVHPDLVDPQWFQRVFEKNQIYYKEGVPQEEYFDDSPVERSINFQDIEY